MTQIATNFLLVFSILDCIEEGCHICISPLYDQQEQKEGSYHCQVKFLNGINQICLTQSVLLFLLYILFALSTFNPLFFNLSSITLCSLTFPLDDYLLITVLTFLLTEKNYHTFLSAAHGLRLRSVGSKDCLNKQKGQVYIEINVKKIL